MICWKSTPPKSPSKRATPTEKQFAQQMITDHTKTSNELKSLVPSDKKSALPTALDDSSQKKLDKLRDAKADDFAGQYDPMQVSAHKDAVSLFERYAKGGDDPKLKDWAGKTTSRLATSPRDGASVGQKPQMRSREVARNCGLAERATARPSGFMMSQTDDPKLPGEIPTPVTGRVVGLAIAPRHRFSKLARESLDLLEGLGAEGDAHAGSFVRHRYLARRQPKMPNLRQVHLIPSELLHVLRADGYEVRSGDLGENIMTAGLDLEALPLGTILKLGAEATVELTGLRTPCVLIDRIQARAQAQDA